MKVLFVSILAAVPALAGPVFNVADLGTHFVANGINSSGVVAGTLFSPTAPIVGAAATHNGTGLTLLNSGGAYDSSASGIRDDGTVIGSTYYLGSQGNPGYSRAVTWSGGAPTALNASDSYGVAIRGAWTAQFFQSGPSNSAYAGIPGVGGYYMDLGAGYFGDVNSSGVAVGYTFTSPVVTQAMVWPSEFSGSFVNPIPLYGLGGAGISSTARGISDGGVIVGMADNYAVQWINGTASALGAGTNSEATAISPDGRYIAGRAGNTIFVYTEGMTYFLDRSVYTSFAPSLDLTVSGINNFGQMAVGHYRVDFSVTPDVSETPEPAGLLLAAGGLALIGILRRRVKIGGWPKQPPTSLCC